MPNNEDMCVCECVFLMLKDSPFFFCYVRRTQGMKIKCHLRVFVCGRVCERERDRSPFSENQS